MADPNPSDMTEWIERVRSVRRARLLSVLPRLYRVQKEGSLVNSLLSAMAGELARLDIAIERVLRDRWIALAEGNPAFAGDCSSIELLAHLGDLWREQAWEAPEAFRRRVRQTLPVLVRGTTSPVGIMTVAAAALDTELCSRTVVRGDTTFGWGLAPGTMAACAACRRDESSPVGPCALDKLGSDSPVRVRLEVVDNPVAIRTLESSSLPFGATLRVRNLSLFEDRPTLRLLAVTELKYPALFSATTGESLYYAGVLAKGETLVIEPARTREEVLPFETSQRLSGPSVDFATAPEGDAYVETIATATAPAGRRPAAGAVYYSVRGDRFGKDDDIAPGAGSDDTGQLHFADQNEVTGSRFAEFGAFRRTPRLVPGENQWELKGYTRTDVEAVTGVGTASDAPAAVDPKSIGELSLTWWVRPPASFLLRIPFAPDLRAQESKRRSAVLDLLVRSVQKARAAGVNCTVDVPEPSHSEQELAVDHWIASKVRVGAAEDATAGEGNSATRLVTTMREPHALEEHNPSFLAKFDVTRLDWNHLGET